MFGKRSDATLVRDLPTMRAIMPFISPRRNDSTFYYTNEVEADAALAYIEKYNESASEDRQLTLFHLVLRATAQVIYARPRVNRFIAGGRIWQRDEVWISYSAKKELVDQAPLVTVKRFFPRDESLDAMVEGILSRTRRRRSGEEKSQSDREMSLAMRFPPFLVRIAVWLLHQANQLGMLPKSMIDDDPLFSTIFIANLGSVDMNAGYHHLWEYGTCSMFCVVGRLRERWDGKRVFDLSYTYDERMEDGLYGGIGMQMIKDAIENPETCAAVWE